MLSGMPAQMAGMCFAFYEPKRRLGSQSSFELVFRPLDHVI
jgi:hypothetical protein